jgi:hypothetical protein
MNCWSASYKDRLLDCKPKALLLASTAFRTTLEATRTKLEVTIKTVPASTIVAGVPPGPDNRTRTPRSARRTRRVQREAEA